MLVERFFDVGNFEKKLGNFLLETPVRNVRILKMMASLAKNPNQYGEVAPWYVAVTHEGQILGAGLRTPPHPLILSEMNPEAALAMATHLRRENIEIPGCRGPVNATSAFAAHWQEVPAEDLVPQTELNLYRLETVTHTLRTDGKLVRATMKELELVMDWVGAFAREVNLVQGGPRRERMRMRIEEGEFFFWKMGGDLTCVLARSARPCHGVSHIGPVYTPPEHRGRGYATDASAILSQLILDDGAKYSSLYADIHNKRTNKIYQMIGYKLVSLHKEYYFKT